MKNTRLVYSSAGDNNCADCGKSLRKCTCADRSSKSSAAQGSVIISKETKGRKGKGVTLIKGVAAKEAELKILAKKLKSLCGSGGTVKDGVIEIQGDHRETLKHYLDSHFQSVKTSGS